MFFACYYCLAFFVLVFSSKSQEILGWIGRFAPSVRPPPSLEAAQPQSLTGVGKYLARMSWNIMSMSNLWFLHNRIEHFNHSSSFGSNLCSLFFCFDVEGLSASGGA
jgi:hypothetical protein